MTYLRMSPSQLLSTLPKLPYALTMLVDTNSLAAAAAPPKPKSTLTRVKTYGPIAAVLLEHLQYTMLTKAEQRLEMVARFGRRLQFFRLEAFCRVSWQDCAHRLARLVPAATAEEAPARRLVLHPKLHEVAMCLTSCCLGRRRWVGANT